MKSLLILCLLHLSIAQIDDGRIFSPVCASVLRPDGKLLHCFFVIFDNPYFMISILL